MCLNHASVQVNDRFHRGDEVRYECERCFDRDGNQLAEKLDGRLRRP